MDKLREQIKGYTIPNENNLCSRAFIDERIFYAFHSLTNHCIQFIYALY